MDIKSVKLFLSCQIVQAWQTFPLFCTSESIRNSFWPNRFFMSHLRHTPFLQPCLKFCSKQGKTSYFDRYANLIPKHNVLGYPFTNTVTEHQKSVYGCFPFLESNLDLWDGSWCLTNGLFKCIVPTATKEFTWSCNIRTFPQAFHSSLIAVHPIIKARLFSWHI